MSQDLSIGEMVTRTGVQEATLRQWERRHGFPRPERLPGGHRRYSERDVELVRRVALDRESGLALPAAIERARVAALEPERSVFAGLRRRRPDLQPRPLSKRLMIALSYAIEDESCARAEHAVLLGSFQRVRFYRHSARRWRELSRTSEIALVLADFGRVREPKGGPVEVPIGGSEPAAREWSLICDAPGYSACLAAWERPIERPLPDGERIFEAVWSVEPDVVREAARAFLDIARPQAPNPAERVERRLAEAPSPPGPDQLRLATAVTSRMLERLS